MLPAIEVARAFVAFCNRYGDWITNLKLQKLLYYAQGWNLALNGGPLFPDRIEAWVGGPVVPAVFDEFRRFKHAPLVLEPEPEFESYPEEVKKLVRDIWSAYGHLTGYELTKIAHTEEPWLKARGGIDLVEPCENEISVEDMMADFKAKPVEEDEPAYA